MAQMITGRLVFNHLLSAFSVYHRCSKTSEIHLLAHLILLAALISLPPASATSIPSLLSNLDCDAAKASSSAKMVKHNSPSAQVLQSGAGPQQSHAEPSTEVIPSQLSVNPLVESLHEVHGAKRKKLLDLNLSPEEDEPEDDNGLRVGSRDPSPFFQKAASPVISSSSKKAHSASIASEESSKTRTNLCFFMPSKTDSNTRHLGTKGSPSGKTLDTKQPYPSENNLQAAKRTSADANNLSDGLPQDNDTDMTRSIEAGASGTENRTGSKRKNRSNTGKSAVSVRSGRCMKNMIHSGGDQFLNCRPPDIEAKALKQITDIFKAPTHNKRTQMMKLFEEYFTFDGEATVAKADPQELPLSSAKDNRTPCESLIEELGLPKPVKKHIKKLTQTTNQFIKEASRGRRAKYVTEKVNLSSYHKMRLTHEVLLVLGMAEFEKIEGQARIVAFFNQAYKKLAELQPPTGTEEIIPVGGTPPRTDTHIALPAEGASTTRKFVIQNSEREPAELETISSLRDKIVQDSVVTRDLLYSLDSTMIFFYFFRYTQEIMNAIRGRIEINSQELETTLINFLTTYWSEFLGFNGLTENYNYGKSRIVSILASNLRVGMNAKRKTHSSTTGIDWARLLLPTCLSLDGSSKWFCKDVIGGSKNEKNFFAFMRSQAFAELRLKTTDNN